MMMTKYSTTALVFDEDVIPPFLQVILAMWYRAIERKGVLNSFSLGIKAVRTQRREPLK